MPLVTTSFTASGPQRVVIVNIETDKEKTVQFNPRSLEMTIGVNYSSQQIPGLSHQINQYINTMNPVIPLEFFVNALSIPATASRQAPTINPDPRVSSNDPSRASQKNREEMDFHNFLLAFVYRQKRRVPFRSSVPEMGFFWPNVLTLVGVVKRLRFRYERFFVNGLAAYIATVDFEASFDRPVTGDAVRQAGFGNSLAATFTGLTGRF